MTGLNTKGTASNRSARSRAYHVAGVATSNTKIYPLAEKTLVRSVITVLSYNSIISCRKEEELATQFGMCSEN